MAKRQNIRDVKAYENEIVVDLDDERDVAAIDRGFGGGHVITEISFIKGGKTVKGFFSVVTRNGKPCMEITFNAKNKTTPTKLLRMIPWRPIN